MVSVVFDSHDTLYVGTLGGARACFCIHHEMLSFTVQDPYPVPEEESPSVHHFSILSFVFTKKMSGQNIVVPSIKTGFSADLPTDMDNPGYWFDDSKVGLERVGRYISKQEWQELAHGANAAHKTHAATSNGFVMKLLFGTCGICFCPLMCYGCFVDVEGNVNADIEKLPVAQKLKGRGITLHFRPKRGKFDMGGMDCAISAKTPALPPVSDTK